MSREFRVDHTDGTSDVLPHVESREESMFSKQDLAVLTTYRSAANNVSLEEAKDEVFLVIDGTDEFGGVLKDVVRKGTEVELVVDSFERYAKDAERTPAGDVYDGATAGDIVTDAVNDVDQLSVGTIENVETGLSFVFNHASQAYKMRKVEEVTQGELRFNADKTVDFVSSLGSDKSGTVLSPSNQNILDDPEVNRVGAEKQITHLLVLGAGEGEHQLTSTAIASSYSAGDRKVWGTYPNKDVQNQDVLDSLASTLIGEVNDEFIEVEAPVRGPVVELGDEFTVTYTEENVNRVLRVVDVTTIISTDGTKYEAILSSRQKTRGDEESKRRKDLDRYNVGFEGNPVAINTGGGRQPVDANNNYLEKVYYPSEVKYEHRLNIRIMALPYRSYQKRTQDHTLDDEAQETNQNVISSVTIDESSWTQLVRRDVDTFGSGDMPFLTLVTLHAWTSGGPVEVDVRFMFYDDAGGFIDEYPDSFGFEGYEIGSNTASLDALVADTDVAEVGVEMQRAAAGTTTVEGGMLMQAIPSHYHLSKPGLDEEFNPGEDKQTLSWTTGSTKKILPMNPDLLVNNVKIAGGEDVVAVDPAGSGRPYQGQGTPLTIGLSSFTQSADDYPLGHSTNADGDEGSYYTQLVDLTGHDELTVDFRTHSIDDGAPSDAASYIIVDQDNPGADHTVYDRRVKVTEETTGDFDVFTKSMDISDLSGNYYIRLHTVGASSGGVDYGVFSKFGHVLLDPIFGELGEVAQEYVVDVTGQLNEGQINDIEVTSAQPGHYQVWVEGDVYRQILGRG